MNTWLYAPLAGFFLVAAITLVAGYPTAAALVAVLGFAWVTAWAVLTRETSDDPAPERRRA